MSRPNQTDPRRKLMLAAGLDGIIVLIGVVLFATPGSVFWIIGAVILGAVLGLPLMLSALREMREQNHASG